MINLESSPPESFENVNYQGKTIHVGDEVIVNPSGTDQNGYRQQHYP